MGAKVLLFGASGKTGRYVAKFALDAGHDVIAFVRDPDKLRSVLVEVGVDPALVDARVTILRGELTDLDSVRSAVRDGGLSRDAGDVIVFCAGKPKSFALVAGAPMLLPAVRAIAETMREVGLKRILIQTGAMSLDGRLRRDPSYRETLHDVLHVAAAVHQGHGRGQLGAHPVRAHGDDGPRVDRHAARPARGDAVEKHGEEGARPRRATRSRRTSTSGSGRRRRCSTRTWCIPRRYSRTWEESRAERSGERSGIGEEVIGASRKSIGRAGEDQAVNTVK